MDKKIYVFTDGRILRRCELLRESDNGNFITVEELPVVEVGENQQVVYFADMDTNTIKYKIVDIPPEEDNEEELFNNGLSIEGFTEITAPVDSEEDTEEVER